MGKEKISYLTFIEKAGYKTTPKGKKYSVSKFKCICGNYIIVRPIDVNNLHTRSCGCKTGELSGMANTKHGLKKTQLYNVWSLIRQRCYNPDCEVYPLYGGDGVTMCDDWYNNFKSFYDWCMANGWKDGLEIDKDIKGGKVYSPDNCSIVTHHENSKHRRSKRIITFQGKTQTITDWAREYGIGQNVLNDRIKHNWSFTEALTTPTNSRRNRVVLKNESSIMYSFGHIN